MLFMVLCVLFLFKGEKILRSIFNINSQANTMADLAASGAIIFGTASKATGLFKDGKGDDSKEDTEAKERKTNRSNRAKENANAATSNIDEKKRNGESLESHGEFQGEDKEPEGVMDDKFDGQAAKDTVLTAAMKNKLKNQIASKATNLVVGGTAGFVGATLAVTKDLSDGKTSAGNIMADVVAGRKAGKAVVAPAIKGVQKLEQRHQGNVIANDIMAGKMDKEIGLRGSPSMPGGEKDYEGEFDDRQKIYREALARYAKAATRGGKEEGEIAYYNYLEQNLKNDSGNK